MAPVRDAESSVKDALFLAEGYRLLALGFRYPDVAELRAELAAATDLPPIAALVSHLDDELGAEHTRLFARNVPVSPYEGSYTRSDKGVLLGQIASLCELFGARVSAEHEPADHIGCELELTALLALKEALGDSDEQREIARAARRVFLEEHLGCWAQAFAARMRETTEHAFYRALGEVLPAWIDRDLEAQGWRAERRFEARGLSVGQDEELGCPNSSDWTSG